AAQALDVLAEERLLAEHQLEAVVVSGVVRAGDHDAAIDRQRVDGKIEHRRGPKADADDIDAALGEAGDQRADELGRAQAAVAADRHALAARRGDNGREGAADRSRILGAERFADDAANVVFAQDGGVEGVAAGRAGLARGAAHRALNNIR